MSMVIDGKDILSYNSYLAVVMSKSLDDLLSGKEKEIRKGILRDAKNLFSIGMDPIREKRGLNLVHQNRDEQRETLMTYRLLIDMLRKVKKVAEEDVDSELERLAIAMQKLTPAGRQVLVDKEQYRTLRNFFIEMYKESSKYTPAFGEHSQYSIGTFDGDGD